MKKYDVIVVGAGHNGLVAAAYLAGAGYEVLVLERRGLLGGAAVTETFSGAPGFKFSTCAEDAGSLHPRIVGDLQLQRYGFETWAADPVTVSMLPDGAALPIWRDPGRTAREIKRFSPKDAEQYPRFVQFVNRMTGVLAQLMTMTPPRLPQPGRGDWFSLAKFGLKARRLGKKDYLDFVRILPMSARDLLAEWFETDEVRGAIAANAVRNISLGPIEIGTGCWFLCRAVGSGNGCYQPAALVKGGMGALTGAIAAAAMEKGAKIRTGCGAADIMVKDGRAVGVVLSDGEEIEAPIVASSADPRRTFLQLIDPTHLEPQFMSDVGNIKMRGSVARVHLALSGTPQFKTPVSGLDGQKATRIQVSPGIHYLEHAYDAAKYGDFARDPYLEISIPSLADPGLAPAGKQVMSITMQHAAYKLRQGDWDGRRSELGDTVLDKLAEVMPRIRDNVEHIEIITPLDLERDYGLTEGNPNHGEMSLDQFFFMRPVAGWARYHTPIKNLYLCGAGAHPGGGVTGVPGMKAAEAIMIEQ